MSAPGNRQPASTLSNWDAWLKEVYPAPAIEQLALAPSPPVEYGKDTLYCRLKLYVNYTQPGYNAVLNTEGDSE